MGEFYRVHGSYEGTKIRCFEPDDTDTVLYVKTNSVGGTSLRELMNKCKEKFPNASFDDIEITAEYIHTDCLGYDRYDPGDYTNYIVATWNK